jgi:transposase
MVYGIELSGRALSYVETGHTIRETSVVFRVSEKTISNWKRLRREKGDIRARPNSRSPHKLPDAELLSYIEANPDKYLREIGDHFGCSDVAVLYACRRLGITYKKTKIIQGKRFSEARGFYRKHQGRS